MKIIIDDKNKWLFRFDKGDEIISLLQDFCYRKKIESGWFWGLGACQKVVLSYYNFKTKKYEDKTFKKDMEIVSLTGNVAKLGNELVIHVHGVFSEKNMKTIGGHVQSLNISGTGEIFFRTLPGKVLRKFDPKTGLNLMHI